MIITVLPTGRVNSEQAVFGDLQIDEIFELERIPGVYLRKIEPYRCCELSLETNAELVLTRTRQLHIPNKTRVWRKVNGNISERIEHVEND
jgi:hypothetical protein